MVAVSVIVEFLYVVCSEDDVLDEYDSWDEDASDSDESDYSPAAPSYPMIIYPMIVSMPATGATSSRFNPKPVDSNERSVCLF